MGRIPPYYCCSLLCDVPADIDFFSLAIPLGLSPFRGPDNVLVLPEPIRVQEIIYPFLVMARTAYRYCSLLKRPLGKLADHFNTLCLVASLFSSTIDDFGTILTTFSYCYS